MESFIATVAANTIAVLIPYVKKGAEGFASEVGRNAGEKVKGLFDTLKARLSGDKFAEESLARFEKEPERYKPYIEDILKEKLAKDKDLATELAKLLKDMGPTLKVIQKMKEAEKVTGLKAKKVTGVTGEVIQEIEKAKEVTGMDIEEVGK